MTRESTKAPKLFVPILLSERTTMKEPGHLLVFLLIFLPSSLIKGCPNTKRAEIHNDVKIPLGHEVHHIMICEYVFHGFLVTNILDPKMRNSEQIDQNAFSESYSANGLTAEREKASLLLFNYT